MVKHPLSGSSTQRDVRFAPPLTAYTVVNDGITSIDVKLDGAVFTVQAGERLNSSHNEKLAVFGVVTNSGGAAWRFLGSDDA